MTLADTSDEILATIERPKGDELRVYRSTYAGRASVRVHLFYTGDDGTPKPTRKCITLRDDELAIVGAALMQAAERIARDGLEADRKARLVRSGA